MATLLMMVTTSIDNVAALDKTQSSHPTSGHLNDNETMILKYNHVPRKIDKTM